MAEAKGQADSRRGYLEVDGSGAMTAQGGAVGYPCLALERDRRLHRP